MNQLQPSQQSKQPFNPTTFEATNSEGNMALSLVCGPNFTIPLARTLFFFVIQYWN